MQQPSIILPAAKFKPSHFWSQKDKDLQIEQTSNWARLSRGPEAGGSSKDGRAGERIMEVSSSYRLVFSLALCLQSTKHLIIMI